MKRVLFALSLVAMTLATLVTGVARAAPPRSSASPIAEPFASVIPAAPPSVAHRWGTAMVFGDQAIIGPSVEQAVLAVEVDVFDQHVVRITELDRLPFVSGTVQSAHIQDDTFVVFGAVCGGDDPAFLYVLDASGRLTEKIALGDGCGPAVVADDQFVVVGLYESHPPVLAPDPSNGWQPREAYHVRVFDRATRRLIGARVFRGDVLLAPKPLVTSGMLALQGHRLFVSLPMIEKARIIGARLPSLVTDAQIDLDVPRDPEASASIAPFSNGIVALAGGWVELSRDLVVKKRRVFAGASSSLVAIEPRTDRIFVDLSGPRGLVAKTPSIEAQGMTWAWGHAVAVGPAPSGVMSLLVIP